MPWKPLQLSPAAGTHLPALLVSASFDSSSYKVYLTDLTHIWSESLSKQDIIRRSRTENTSIDPSNGDQFKIFLQKIKFGLEGGKDSALSLTINSDLDRPSLVLHVSVHLPGGLLPLEWPIHLSPGSQHLLSSQLTVPLLRAQHERLQELSGLAEVLKEKDHVIQKLLDKLEDQGTDLGQLFPQVAGRPGRKVDRKKAEERVKGLGAFDMNTWKEGIRGHGATQDVAKLLSEVFQVSDKQIEVEETESDDWWDDLSGITVNLSTGKISTKGVPRDRRSPFKAPLPLPVQDSIDENDDFQVQSTPPHLSKPIPRGDDTTEDDDDLNAPSQRSKVPDSFPVSQIAAQPSPPPKVTKKLGIIGKKKKTPQPEPEPDPMLDDETASESEHGSAISPTGHARSPPKRTPPPPPQPKSKKDLGRIGGKKEPPPHSKLSSSPEPTVPAAKSIPQPVKSKLGKIGGKKATAAGQKESSPTPDISTDLPVIESAHHSKHKIGTISHYKAEAATAPVEPIKKKEETPEPDVPEETAEEKANRKRLQLKRELEEKAKAPVKKKRKF